MDNIQSGSANHEEKKIKGLMDLCKSSIYDYMFLFVWKNKKMHTYLRAALGWEHISLPKIKAVPSEGDSSPVWKRKNTTFSSQPIRSKEKCQIYRYPILSNYNYKKSFL